MVVYTRFLCSGGDVSVIVFLDGVRGGWYGLVLGLRGLGGESRCGVFSCRVVLDGRRAGDVLGFLYGLAGERGLKVFYRGDCSGVLAFLGV